MNRLILGTAQFGLNYGVSNNQGQTPFSEVVKILDFAWESGINSLDTAANYGNAHEVIGRYHAQRKHRFDIFTKFQANENFDKHQFIPLSLTQLNVDKLSGVYYHRLQDIQKVPMFNEQPLGASVYSLDDVIALQNRPFISLYQIPYSALDSCHEKRRLLTQLKDRGLEIHTRSTFLQGLLLTDSPPQSLKDISFYRKRLSDLAESADISLGELALRYCLANPSIDKILVGVNNLSHIKDIVAWQRSGPLPSNLVEAIQRMSQPPAQLLDPRNW